MPVAATGILFFQNEVKNIKKENFCNNEYTLEIWEV